MINASELQSALRGFTGTEQYHKLTFSPNIVFTDGVAYLAEKAGAFWLVNAIMSHQPKCMKDKMLRDIQFWTLKVKDRKGVLTCERDTNDVAVKQNIDYTDFPLDEIKLIVEQGAVGERAVMVCMLQSER